MNHHGNVACEIGAYGLYINRQVLVMYLSMYLIFREHLYTSLGAHIGCFGQIIIHNTHKNKFIPQLNDEKNKTKFKIRNCKIIKSIIYTK